MKRVFVTVGTTRFDELVETVISEETVKVMLSVKPIRPTYSLTLVQVHSQAIVIARHQFC